MGLHTQPEWFETWFDTSYYQILYHHRDDQEAGLFLDNLLQYLALPPGARVMDVASGKGRFTRDLEKRGFDVTGIDLSYRNIQHASNYESDSLTFFVHDMREVFRINYFDAVFNFFTSFGYFKSDKDNLKSVRALAFSLKKNGRLVIDFFNSRKVIREMVSQQQIVQGGILFSVKKELNDRTIVKKIYFQDRGKEFQFEERVQALMPEDFERYFSASGLRMKDVFGDYRLGPFDPAESDRMIVVGEKK